MAGPWRIHIDTGGTFADCVAVAPDGSTRRAKVLSSGAMRGVVSGAAGPDMLFVEESWGAPSRFVVGMRFHLPGQSAGSAPEERRIVGYDAAGGIIRLDRPLTPPPPMGSVFEAVGDEGAPVLAARLVTRTLPGSPLPPIEMRLGTTRGTNALLERSGARVALFVTRGFADLLRIGTQQRPDLFTLQIVKPAPLYELVVEVPERLAADGSVLEPLDLKRIERRADEALASGIRAAAVCLLHAWANPEHERALATFLRVRGFEHVSDSAALSPTIKVLPRAETAVVNAYLSPVIGAYLERIGDALRREGGAATPATPLRVMTSAGGLAAAPAFAPKDSLLSGPAGGVAGAAAAAARSGFERVISFDMGGTSTDVARIESAAAAGFEYSFEHEVAGAHIAAPALAVESVAAGGGSVCWFDGDGLQVGPRSAGASPGPACYGAAGPLTITDANLVLGRFDPARFRIPVAEAAAHEALEHVRRRLPEASRPVPEALAAGFLDIACNRMADAIRRISIRRGYDPADYALVAFGGAGPQHACRVADLLGIRVVLIPPDPGLLCAAGLGRASVERFVVRQVLEPLDRVEARLAAIVRDAADEAARLLEREGVRTAGAHRSASVALRFAGQESSIDLPCTGDPLLPEFERRYRATFGHWPRGGGGGRAVEVESVRASVAVPPDAAEPPSPSPAAHDGDPAGRHRAWFGDGWAEAPLFDRAALLPGARFEGPALVFEETSSIVVEPGWRARVDGAGALVLEAAPQRTTPERTGRGSTAWPDLATGRLAAIAGDMSDMLRRTALSTNVKERLDYSCALLDADGVLIANAPNIPVHLGALGVCVRAVREAIAMGPGDVVVTNHPAFGGSHLPDITLVMPLFDDDGTPLAYVANRAHHAEIGGVRPGSMPGDSRTLADEGVAIRPMHLIRAGEARWSDVHQLLVAGPHPSRAVEDNLADLNAQLAACVRGAQSVGAFAREHGRDALREAMAELARRADRRLADALRRLRGGRTGPIAWSAADALDDGTPIRVRIESTLDPADPSRDRLIVDFAGTGGIHAGNLNATPAIVRSAVVYVLRLLADDPLLPLNEGLLSHVDLRVPTGLLNPPFDGNPARCPAVAGGNTETSQRIVDVLVQALGLAASSQGTMNNIAFGNASFGYYETVCGGAGAGDGFAGASAVHTHMTNTRITDPEVLERRYPVRLDRFAIRRGSGGTGRWQGGDGVEREIRFLEACTLSILSQRRGSGPPGHAGGGQGQSGRQTLIRADGAEVELPATGACEVAPGDRLRLRTPGAGGWGVGNACSD